MPNRKQDMTRREFLRDGALGIGAATAPGALSSCEKQETSIKEQAMPTRILGRTGLEVSVVSFGGESQFLKNEDGVWEPMLERAIELAEQKAQAQDYASLETRLAHLAGPQTLCWARPGYFDGMMC